MTRWLLLLAALAATLTTPAQAQETRAAAVSLQRHADGSTGTLEVELYPSDAWRRDVFVSLYRGSLRERRGIRPDDDGGYRLDVNVPEAGEWGVYLRYGVAQAGYAGYGRLIVPAVGGRAATTLALSSGFPAGVPAYVQPLGFTVFAVIAVLVTLGLRVLLQLIRRRQAGQPTAG